MGYSNVPFAVGRAGANFVSGPIYDHISDKSELARDDLVMRLGHEQDTVDALSKGESMATLPPGLGRSEAGARQVHWEHNNQPSFRFLCMAVGLLSTLALVAYHSWFPTESKQRAALNT